MFKVKSISITGFWQSKEVDSSFRDDVNIIIGKNGTGKTTFMNILRAVLTVDLDALYGNAFHSVTINLTDGKKTKKIFANKIEADPFPRIEYRISNRRYVVSLISPEDGKNLPLSMRRRFIEESSRIKQELAELAAVASLSVYRIGGDPDLEFRERSPKRYASTVDMRLASLMQRLTQYQLELSNQAREISAGLQRDVLISLLYSEEKAKNPGYTIEFDERIERQNLVSAYKQLGVSGTEVSKKIQDHIATVTTTVKNLKSLSQKVGKEAETKTVGLVDLSALEAFKLTQTVITKSLAAEQKTKAIFSQVDLFLQTLKTFVEDKTFTFSAGELTVANEGSIPLEKLSSGEKQLLILFIEALLQRKQPYIFLADEPELSLHISWQRHIVSAIRSLNPNAQIIVATHSPEIAGKFRECILSTLSKVF
ncbi:AAA family ATPase [Noviherbaspirillum sedimenti]|uniref:ATP-binding protein n=1 Tax=Noviherbaspirillum sedimenti TaxID=2320865 RepID=A0A3A3FXI3_9BURK|nr:AAA family ATPase [Noviherbaspirillum sedimenti]RJG00918.1 ATP-binding protein [Noviherbaspirillum sedimenti]